MLSGVIHHAPRLPVLCSRRLATDVADAKDNRLLKHVNVLHIWERGAPFHKLPLPVHTTALKKVASPRRVLIHEEVPPTDRKSVV